MDKNMTSETAIINILQEQVSSYKLLHDLLRRERTCLVNIEPEKVTEIAKEKDTVLMRIRLLEEERIRLIKKFVQANDINDGVNLKELEKHTGNNMFTILRSQLLSLLQSIEEMNQFNSILIDRSLNYIKTTKNAISSFAEGNITQTTGVLLSRET